MSEIEEIRKQLKSAGISDDLPDDVLIELLKELKVEDTQESENEEEEDTENENSINESLEGSSYISTPLKTIHEENDSDNEDTPPPIVFTSPSRPNPYYMSPDSTMDSKMENSINYTKLTSQTPTKPENIEQSTSPANISSTLKEESDEDDYTTDGNKSAEINNTYEEEDSNIQDQSFIYSSTSVSSVTSSLNTPVASKSTSLKSTPASISKNIVKSNMSNNNIPSCPSISNNIPKLNHSSPSQPLTPYLMDNNSDSDKEDDDYSGFILGTSNIITNTNKSSSTITKPKLIHEIPTTTTTATTGISNTFHHHNINNNNKENKLTKSFSLKSNIIKPKNTKLSTTSTSTSPIQHIHNSKPTVLQCHCQNKPSVPYTYLHTSSSATPSFIKKNYKNEINTGRCHKHDPVSSYKKINNEWKKVSVLQNKKNKPKSYNKVKIIKRSHPDIPSNYIPGPMKRRDNLVFKLREKMMNYEMITPDRNLDLDQSAFYL